MPDVPLISVGRIVMTWIWSFSCDVSMKNILKFVGLFFWYRLALDLNVDMATLLNKSNCFIQDGGHGSGS